VATVLIKNGTLKTGDAIVVGATYGKVRALVTEKGEKRSSAGPAMPIEILGLPEVPQPGDLLEAFSDEKSARAAVEEKRAKLEPKRRLFTLETYSKEIKSGEVKDLNLIIKADVQGSLEALTSSLKNLSTEKIHVNIIHAGVGAILESDIMLAKASEAIVIGFGVSFNGEAKAMAEAEGVDAREYHVIYEVTDNVKLAMEGLLEPEYEEVVIGQAVVRALFKYSKVGVIAGCFIPDGKLLRGGPIRVKRDQKIIYEGKLESLRRFKEDVKEVAQGFECGVAVTGFNAWQEGDVIEAYEMRVKPKKL
jgi:translation initiation factor IF-2